MERAGGRVRLDMLRDPKAEHYRQQAARQSRPRGQTREERAHEQQLRRPQPVALPDTIRCAYCGADITRDGCPNDGPQWPGRHWRP